MEKSVRPLVHQKTKTKPELLKPLKIVYGVIEEGLSGD